MASFLKQLKGIYFLAVPHSGVPLFEDQDQRSKIYTAMAELGEEVARLNQDFRALEHSWRSITIYATHAHETEPHYCLNEGSARNGADEFLSIDTDGEQITRPKDENSGCFPSLRQLIEEVLSEFRARNFLPGKRQKKYNRPRLPFARDPLYVPIEGMIQKVREHLLTDHEKVVLLCGEAGIGKTSLVKYLALQYEDEFKNQEAHEAVFKHGCCFVECGPGAEVVKVQRDLLYRLLGVNGARKYDRLNHPPTLKQVLEDHLQELDVLIIIDNLWDYYLLECLVVGGKTVKYLVTGQQCHRQRGDSWEMKICRMDDVGEDYGKKIFASRMRFPNRVIPENLQCIVIKILEETGCNPLAIDTLSLTVREKRRTEIREWSEILEHIHLYLERSGHGDASTTYPRGFFPSMMYAVELLSEGRRPELELLYVISLLQGPAIHWTVIKSLTGCVAPHLENQVSVLLHHLEILTLVQRRDAGDESPGSGLDEYVSINPSRQHYMLLSTKGPIVSVREKIDSLLFHPSSGDGSAQALCLLYGESNTRATIAAHRGIPVSRLSLQFRTLEAARELLFPFVPGFLHRSDTTAIRRQMFTELVLEGKLQTGVILQVLDTPSGEFNASRVLVELFLAMNPESSTDFLHVFELAFYSLLNHFFEHREVVEAFHMLEGFIEGIICRGRFPDKFSIPVLPVSSDPNDAFGPVDESMWEELQKSIEDVACITNRLYVSTAGPRPYLKLGPGAIEAMVTSLSAANSKTEEAQFEAVAIFAFTVLASDDPKSLFVFDTVERLLGVLQGNKETSLGFEVDGVNLVRLSEILVIVTFRHGFIRGLQIVGNLLESNQFKALIEQAMTTLVRRALEFEGKYLGGCVLKIITHMVCQLRAASWPCFRKVLPEVLNQFHWWNQVPSVGHFSFFLMDKVFAMVLSRKTRMHPSVHEEVLSFLKDSLVAPSVVTCREGTIIVRVLAQTDKFHDEFRRIYPPFVYHHGYNISELNISGVLKLGSDEQHLMSLDTEETLAYLRNSYEIQTELISLNEVTFDLSQHHTWADWADFKRMRA